MDFYNMTKNVSHFYSKLQDGLSQDVFWARLQFDIRPSVDGWLRLVQLSGLLPPEEFEVQLGCKKVVGDLLDQGKKLLLYGAGIRGGTIAKCLLNDGINISGFCDRGFDKFTDGMLGKTVYSPSFLLEHSSTYYIIITSVSFRKEIVQFLKEHGFPEDHILPYFSDYFLEHGESCPEQYFEFPQLFPKGTAFVDAGSFDGADSIHFAQWCGGEYSKIFAFEPDPVNVERCRKHLAGTAGVEVVHGGLGEHTAESKFLSYGQMHSRFTDTKRERHIVDEVLLGAAAEAVQVIALDDLTQDQTVGFIKMDIEGAEWQALHGAEQTILRDKPLLAVCVYHVPGDMLAIMDYLSGLVPEYRFWLRHYGTSFNDTVLYASTKDMNGQKG